MKKPLNIFEFIIIGILGIGVGIVVPNIYNDSLLILDKKKQVYILIFILVFLYYIIYGRKT